MAPNPTDRPDPSTPAIVLGGHVVALGVIRSLGIQQVPIINIYHEKRAFSFASRFVSEKIRAPYPERHEPEFISLIIDCAKRHGRCLVIPADDTTLSVVSRHKTELEQHHTVACPNWSVTEKFIDKKFTYSLAESLGIATPQTCAPAGPQDLEKIADEFLFPCLVKPRQGHRYYDLFGKKMARINNVREMLTEYNLAREADLEVLVQELIPGNDSQGVSYLSYRSPGKIVDFTAQKIRMGPPQFGVPRVTLGARIPEIVEPARKILEALGYFGYSCTEFKLDHRDGVYKFMEVNGRFNRSILHPLKCGINFPWLAYQDLLFQTPIEGRQPDTPVYWIDLYNDLYYSLRSLAHERYSPRSYLSPYFHKKTCAILDFKDLKPFFRRIGSLFR